MSGRESRGEQRGSKSGVGIYERKINNTVSRAYQLTIIAIINSLIHCFFLYYTVRVSLFFFFSSPLSSFGQVMSPAELGSFFHSTLCFSSFLLNSPQSTLLSVFS